jgi:NTE family protein
MSDSEARRVLVLQGGGALGSYQAGVYEGLAEHDMRPDWVAGISIGAINAALIAGNPPDKQVERLREFWRLVSDGPQAPDWGLGGSTRGLVSQVNAAGVLLFGVSGFFAPRFPPPQLQPPGTLAAISFYETSSLKATLERLVDFDRLNAGETRLSVGAVNVQTGNFAYFDNQQMRIGPEHIMASGALPPGLPPVEIDGEFYWDGGLVSNTPLEYVLDEPNGHDLLIFQVDLFPARGPMPGTLAEAAEREMDIRYSSRTRLNTDMAMRIHRAKCLVRRLLEQLPPDLAASRTAHVLAEMSAEHAVTIVQLIYRRQAYESHSKDYEFSRATMLEHWTSGVAAVDRSLANGEAMFKPGPGISFQTFDEDEHLAANGSPAGEKTMAAESAPDERSLQTKEHL